MATPEVRNSRPAARLATVFLCALGHLRRVAQDRGAFVSQWTRDGLMLTLSDVDNHGVRDPRCVDPVPLEVLHLKAGLVVGDLHKLSADVNVMQECTPYDVRTTGSLNRNALQPPDLNRPPALRGT